MVLAHIASFPVEELAAGASVLAIAVVWIELGQRLAALRRRLARSARSIR